MTTFPHAAMARFWIDAWNSRDLDRIMTLYDDKAEMSSLGIIILGINDEGQLKGKKRIRSYWKRALEARPELHFELLDVSTSPDSVIVRYRNDRGATVNEYLRLNAEGRIVQGSANHLEG